MKIYVVMGTTGEYSDRNEWAVIAYTQLHDAESHIAAATARALQIQQEIQEVSIATGYVGYVEQKKFHKTNQFDPDMQMDYTGTSYFYHEVELLESRA